MKKIYLGTFLLVILMAVNSFADRGGHMMGSGMMGSPGYGESKESGEYGYRHHGMMGPGMMGYGGYGMMGYGMGPGMMGYGGCGMMGPGMMGYGMGPGMMGHHQMMHGMGPGMMGYGGCGMMGGYGAKESQKFLDDTKDLRKKLHSKKFDYFEAARKPDVKREDLSKLEKEIWELQEKINEKWKK